MEFARTHLPCPSCKSSDAYCENDDGSGKCFSCGKFFPANGGEPMDEELDMGDIPELNVNDEYRAIDFRGITEKTFRKYNTTFKFKPGETRPITVGFPYAKDLTKVRLLDEKRFYWVGAAKRRALLFGMESFQPGGDSIVITEGEFDAPSVYQMLGGVPSVSVRSSGQAFDDCKEHYEYLNSFNKIYLCFDNDEPGRKALDKVSPMFDFNKVYKITLTLAKDANDYLQAGLEREFRDAFRKAQKCVPEGVVSSLTEIETILDAPPREVNAQYPFRQLNTILQGMSFGESVLFSGLEGIGKTEILRAIEYNVLKTTDYNIGVVHLEETNKATINRLLNYEMKIPLHLSSSDVPKNAKLEAYKAMTGRDNRVVYYSHYGEHSPDTILGIIRFLVAVCGCRFVFFDHLNIVVSSMEASVDERRALDYLCTKLESLVESLNFHFTAVCHTNDNGLTRGSRNISQTSHVHVGLSRSIDSPDESERRRIAMVVRKNRPTGFSGPAGYAYYDDETGTLKDPEEEPDLDFLVPLKE